MPRPGAALAALAALLALAAPAAAATPEAALSGRLARVLARAGGGSGAYVYNATAGHVVLACRSRVPRVLASNTKLFTTATALAGYGPEGRMRTSVLAVGELAPDGVLHGDLYLSGGGDPTFGSRRFVLRNYGAGATVEALAAGLKQAGLRAVDGRVYGDESRFDSLRGGPDSGWVTSIWVGPLSALSFNHGAYSRAPAAFAAARLTAVLKRAGVHVGRRARAGLTPPEARELAFVESPSMALLAQMTNKPSDNFFAEMLLKDVAARRGRQGTTRRGAAAVRRFARRLGARASIVDGSGLSRWNRASPYSVVRLLLAEQARPEFPAFHDSLSIAGRDGTLRKRMRRGPARGHCHGKTGTLSNVSALSGYCTARSGQVYVFSILMNGVYPYAARKLQDRMAQAVAGSGPPVSARR